MILWRRRVSSVAIKESRLNRIDWNPVVKKKAHQENKNLGELERKGVQRELS